MEIKIKFIYFILILCSYLFSFKSSEYKIKYFGINAAICKSSYTDTTITLINPTNLDKKKTIQCIKIEYNVKSSGLFNKIYPIENSYITIIDQEYNLIHFSKKTSQPKLTNLISTEPIGHDFYNKMELNYNNTTCTIPANVYNIFSLLYIIENNPQYLISKDKILLEKEGKLYHCNVLLSENTYQLIFNELDDTESILKNTDIFTWGIFIDGSERYVNIESEEISKSTFKNKHISFTAVKN